MSCDEVPTTYEYFNGSQRSEKIEFVAILSTLEICEKNTITFIRKNYKRCIRLHHAKTAESQYNVGINK